MGLKGRSGRGGRQVGAGWGGAGGASGRPVAGLRVGAAARRAAGRGGPCMQPRVRRWSMTDCMMAMI